MQAWGLKLYIIKKSTDWNIWAITADSLSVASVFAKCEDLLPCVKVALEKNKMLLFLFKINTHAYKYSLVYVISAGDVWMYRKGNFMLWVVSRLEAAGVGSRLILPSFSRFSTAFFIQFLIYWISFVHQRHLASPPLSQEVKVAGTASVLIYSFHKSP